MTDRWAEGRKVSSEVVARKADEFAESIRDVVDMLSSGVYETRKKDRDGLPRWAVGAPPSDTEVAKELNRAAIPGPQGRTGTWTARAVLNHRKRIAEIDARKPSKATLSESAKALRAEMEAENAEEAARELKIRERIVRGNVERREKAKAALTPEQFEEWERQAVMLGDRYTVEEMVEEEERVVEVAHEQLRNMTPEELKEMQRRIDLDTKYQSLQKQIWWIEKRKGWHR
jgi:hypothetical protein